ncbi:LOW QUALITY PROTEIN: coiled-coil domain-containing protein 157-like [Mya arenaria]|uniref:LOW QUALITY PROTEIN: coiled-coil domain-containing protein 157-like n=1 Tax=Mya arenaria TaxID=6604 RepID=UPI0022E75747|nr:LOW QUALITY PROTEIN: coiled-coil domain-containing protein 157-like [Mya arenaria]
MAYLLGAAAVMESLQNDVRDVQSCIVDITSRIGPVPCTSWKFPDKQAGELDVEDLLDLYGYSDDDEEKQVAHIALYELVIDRLVLLLHGMASYTEGVMKQASCETDQAPKSGTSVGVVAKRYWNRLSHLQQAVKQIVQEKGAMSRKVSELEGDVRRLDSELKQAYASNRPKTSGLGGLIPPNRAEMITGLSCDPSKLKEFGLLGRDEYNKGCQTNETAFTPCDSCSHVQRSFRQSGDIVVGICQQQQIPSCLQKFRPQVSHLDWLSGNDVARWAAEQNKDLQRISKLTATIQPLKEELNECREKSDKLEKRVQNFDRDLKRERDDRTALHREYEKKIKEMDLNHTKILELEKQERDALEASKHEVERMLERQKTDLLEKQSLLREMESTKSTLEHELTSTKVESAEVERLQREMTMLQGRLDNVAVKMDQSSRELQREQAKSKSATKHTQSLQSKQESLLVRIEVLDEENRELKDKLSEVEDEKDSLEEKFEELQRQTTQKENQIKEKQVEIEHFRADIESLEQSITTMDKSICGLNDRLEEAKERERLIVEYPDVNGPVNPDLTGTGDILLDMENQVKANSIRIQLLETQNEGLRNSITKLAGVGDPLGDGGTMEGDSGEQRWAVHVQRNNPKPLWDTDIVQGQGHRHEEDYSRPEYSDMENMYNEAHVTSNKPDHKPAATKGIWNQAYIKNNKAKVQSGIKNMEFDNSAMKQKTSPNKDRAPFGHRPLSSDTSKKPGGDFIVGRAMSRPGSAKPHDQASSSGKSRPSSGKTYMAPVNATSISAYLQMKRAGKLDHPAGASQKTSGSRPGSSIRPRIPTAEEDDGYTRRENFSCCNCDKMYTRQRDLDIHMSYCSG